METHRDHMKRYRFGSKRPHSNNAQTVIGLWIAGLIMIIFLILGGIKLVTDYHAAPVRSHGRTSRHISKRSQSEVRHHKGNHVTPSIRNQKMIHTLKKIADRLLPRSLIIINSTSLP